MSFIDDWLLIDEWTFKQASLLFNGHDPDREYEVDFNANITGLNKESIADWELDVLKTYQILKKADWQEYAGSKATSVSLYQSGHYKYFFALAKIKQLKLPDELIKKWEILGNSFQQMNEKEDQNRSTEYTTRKLDLLLAAKKKFWSLYDKADPSTAPTNEQVKEWLIKQKDNHGRPISKKAAEVMASILRDESLPPGPRK